MTMETSPSLKAMQLLQRASTAAKGLRALQGLVLLRMARLYLDREEPAWVRHMGFTGI